MSNDIFDEVVFDIIRRLSRNGEAPTKLDICIKLVEMRAITENFLLYVVEGSDRKLRRSLERLIRSGHLTTKRENVSYLHTYMPKYVDE